MEVSARDSPARRPHTHPHISLSTHIYTSSHTYSNLIHPHAPIMQEGDRRHEVVVSLVSELVLCVKEANTKTRGTAYALLVQVGGTGRDGGRKGEAPPHPPS